MNAQPFDLMDQCFNGEVRGEGRGKVVIKLVKGNQRWYFRKIMATACLFLGIDSPGGIDYDVELIPRRNRFLLYENLT
jgi:hypothetical protein